MKSRIRIGDCREVLGDMAACSFHSVVTDPPYGISFMGSGWDKKVPGVVFWEAIFRVLRPGGHLLAFGGTRTHHRLMVAIEDAGFEIRDAIIWLYATGFPKSLDVAKAIDKRNGDERPIIGRRYRASTGRMRQGEGGYAYGEHFAVTSPASSSSAKWEGFGTAIKPAHEPIILARRPLVGTVARTIEAFECGGLNIDACRISLEGEVSPTSQRYEAGKMQHGNHGWAHSRPVCWLWIYRCCGCA